MVTEDSKNSKFTNSGEKKSFLSRKISVHSSHHQRAVKSKKALAPQQRRINSAVTEYRAFKRKFNADQPTNKCILQ